MTKHYNAAPFEILQRYKFNTRVCQPTESSAVYVSALRSLVENCNYDGALNKMLRHHLVRGANDDTTQRRLLSECCVTVWYAVLMTTQYNATCCRKRVCLTFVNTQSIAQNAEAVASNVKKLHRKP